MTENPTNNNLEADTSHLFLLFWAPVQFCVHAQVKFKLKHHHLNQIPKRFAVGKIFLDVIL